MRKVVITVEDTENGIKTSIESNGFPALELLGVFELLKADAVNNIRKEKKK